MQELISIIENYTEEEVINADTNLMMDLGLSSFDAACIIDEVQSKTGISVSVKEFYKCTTIGELADFINSQK
ncbi:MAG: acyl carrier protein [Acutalibacteraceae bacterium]